MSGPRSEKEIRELLRKEMSKMAELINQGRKMEALELLRQASNNAKLILREDLAYEGKKLVEHPDYIEPKRLADKMFEKLDLAYLTRDIPSIQKLMSFSDEDFLIILYQATYVASSYNESSKDLMPSLRDWFVLGFYAYIFELGCKALISYANTLTGKNHTKCGEVVNLLKYKYTGLEKVAEYFDHFLRNAVDHSNYIITDLATGKMEAWNVKNGLRSPNKNYELLPIFKTTTKILFFVIAVHECFYDLMLSLNLK